MDATSSLGPRYLILSFKPSLSTNCFLYFSKKDTVTTNTENVVHEPNEMKDILEGWLKPSDEDGGKETEKVEPKGKVDINKKLDNLFD